MATPDYDQVLKNNQEAASLSAKAAQEARDAYTQIINTKVVGTNGQLRALSAADTLADAPVGDAAKLKGKLDIKSLANYDDLSSAPIGDRVKFAKDNGIVYADHIERVGLNNGNLLEPYVRDSAGNTIYLVPKKILDDAISALSLMSISLGDEAWKVRQRLGLGNDNAGRAALGVPEASNITRVGLDGGNKWKPFVVRTDGSVQYLVAANDGVNRLGMIDSKTAYIGHNDGYFRLLTSGNTTIDSNGFVKSASPIARVGDALDTLSRDFYPAGDGSTNDEAIGVSCERISEGVYKVTGADGFADDGIWTIETPKDENGQALLWVNTKQETGGTIIVETYHRTHPGAPVFARNNVEGKNDGDPIDIPAGRWIDLRLKMPEKKKPQE